MTAVMPRSQMTSIREGLQRDAHGLTAMLMEYNQAGNRERAEAIRAALYEAGDPVAAEHEYGEVMFRLNRLNGTLMNAIDDARAAEAALDRVLKRHDRASRAGAR